MLHFHINSFAIAKENVIYVLRLNAFEIFAVHGNILSNESVSLHLLRLAEVLEMRWRKLNTFTGPGDRNNGKSVGSQ